MDNSKKHWLDDYQDVRQFFGNMDALKKQPVIKFSVWRADPTRNNMHFPLFVIASEVKIGDLIFVESQNFEGFARVSDFCRDSDGKFHHFRMEDMKFSVDKANLMLFAVKKLIDEAAVAGIAKDVTVVMSISEAEVK